MRCQAPLLRGAAAAFPCDAVGAPCAGFWTLILPPRIVINPQTVSRWIAENVSRSLYIHAPEQDAAGGRTLLLHAFLDRVLDVLDLVDLDVEQLALDLLDPADVDRLDDVACFRIDRDRPARAFPLHAL